MVIIPTTSTDGHSQPVAITGQEGQDPDEPPIPRPSSSSEEVKQVKETPVTDLSAVGTASNSVTVVNSRDGWSAFTGNADNAHVCDHNDVAKFLEVDPVYVHIRFSRNPAYVFKIVLVSHLMMQKSVSKPMVQIRSMALGKYPYGRYCFGKCPIV